MNIKDNLNTFHHIRKKLIDKTSNIIKPVVKPVVKHITKHHKKYIFGTMGSLLTYLFFVKVFLFKVVILKAILAILAIFGIYSWHTTFATVQTICINDEKLIPLSTCETNFTNLKDAITYLEAKKNVPDATLYDSINYQIIKETLNHYCPENITKEINQIVKNIIEQKTSGLPQQKIRRLSALSTLFETYQKHIIKIDENTDTTDDFCQKKYIDYALIDKSKKDFMGILDTSNLRITQNSVFDSINRKDDYILGPMIDEQIVATKKMSNNQDQLAIKNNKIYDTYYASGSYSRKISEKIVQLSNTVINASVQKLKDKNVLTAADTSNLNSKITVKYTPDCRKTQGYSTITQLIGANKKIVGAKFQNITLNINICFNYQYIQNLKDYIQQITVHEIGHYVYYMKDGDPQSFEKICRKNNRISCPRNEFVSTYAQSLPAEDYAESFLHRYLGDSATKNIYTGNYYSGNYYSGSYIAQTNKSFASKLNHFSTLF